MSKPDVAGLGFVTLMMTATCIALPANRPEAVIPLFAVPAVWAGLIRYPLRLLVLRVVFLSGFLLAALAPSIWFDRAPEMVFGMQSTLGVARVVTGLLKFGVTASLLLLLHRTVPFPRLLSLLTFLPSPLIAQLALLYRFLGTAQKRTQEIALAAGLRGFKRASLRRRVGVVGAQVFSLILEGFQRGEAAATYLALRGFYGKFPLIMRIRWRLADTIVAAPVVALSGYAMSLGWSMF